MIALTTSEPMKNQITGEALKKCESCDVAFSCGAEKNDCWCFFAEVSPEHLTQLKKQFDQCLCPQCLKSLKSLTAPAETAVYPA